MGAPFKVKFSGQTAELLYKGNKECMTHEFLLFFIVYFNFNWN